MNVVNEKPLDARHRAIEASDRRRSSREPVITIGSLRVLDDLKEAGRQVRVVDVSMHGVGMRANFELEMGELFSIEIGVGPLRLASQMRVARVRALDDGSYDIGGEFC